MAPGTSELEPLSLPETKEYSHRAHRFPGKFHPPLVAKLLEDSPDHEVIADPMCGSGTVGVEAAVAGKDALCVDIDPLSALMAKAKAHPVDPDELLQVGEQIRDRADSTPDEGEIESDDAREEVEANLKGTPFCVPINLFHWFDPYVAVGYSRLLNSAHEVLNGVSPEMDDAVRTSLAAMVRQTSRADPQPVSGLEVTSVREEQLEEGIDFDVESSFNRVLKRLARGYEQLLEVETLGDVTVVEGDSRRFSAVCDEHDYRPSLVITSPPYCNAIEYHRRHRLEYEWLGLFNGEDVDDPRDNRIDTSRDFFGSTTTRQDDLRDLPEAPLEEVREITAKIEAKGKERKANLLREYFIDAEIWIEEIHEALTDDGLLCMTVGPSTSYGHTLNTPKYLQDLAEETGFDVEMKHPYRLINNKMQYPTENGEPTETLLKLRAR